MSDTERRCNADIVRLRQAKQIGCQTDSLLSQRRGPLGQLNFMISFSDEDLISIY
jgi:hypothetical protein